MEMDRANSSSGGSRLAGNRELGHGGHDSTPVASIRRRPCRKEDGIPGAQIRGADSSCGGFSYFFHAGFRARSVITKSLPPPVKKLDKENLRKPEKNSAKEA